MLQKAYGTTLHLNVEAPTTTQKRARDTRVDADGVSTHTKWRQAVISNSKCWSCDFSPSVASGEVVRSFGLASADLRVSRATLCTLGAIDF